MVSVLMITHNRSEELIDTVKNILEQTHKNIEIIIVENGSLDAVIQKNRELLKDFDLQYIVSNENLGVSGGRNLALKEANGDVIIEIDDDAVFDDPKSIDNVISFFEKNPTIGIQAFQIINYYTRKITNEEYPFRDKSRDSNSEGYTTWFIGAGHAFRKELIDEIGLYRDFFPWGSEEQDFSVRALNAGYEIFYNPEIIVYHKKSPNGRIENRIKFGGIALKNRIKFTLLNYPFRYALIHSIIRSTQSVIKFKSIRVLVLAINHLYNEFSYIVDNRKVIGKDTRKKLIERDGQLYY
ncbi:MAG: glycosyltransferase [Balneolaceae bacterium]|nr:glycosyltransferase [Balneolaceae bacterium]